MSSYDVEEILDIRKTKAGKVEFLVRWAPSWEAQKNLSCAKLIKEFKAKRGEENGEDDADEDEDEEPEDEPKAANTSKRGTPRKAATAANKKRKAAAKSGKKSKSRRRR